MLTEHGILFRATKTDSIRIDEKGEKWVTVEINKAAADYIREGVVEVMKKRFRENITDESNKARYEFSQRLKEDINSIRELLD